MSKRPKPSKGQQTFSFSKKTKTTTDENDGTDWGFSLSTNKQASTAPSTSSDSKKKYEAKRKRGFIDAWGHEFEWVKCENDTMFCSVCREFPTVSDPKSTLVIGVAGNKRRETLVHHNTSGPHIRCAQKKALQKCENKGQLEACVEKHMKKMTDKERAQLSSKINTAFYVAQKKMAFEPFSSLCQLQQKNGLDLGTRYRSDKACRDFI